MEGSCCLDFGNCHSKSTLAKKDPETGLITILRVPYHTTLADPNRQNIMNASDSQRDFVALAGLESTTGKLIQGKRSRAMARTFPCKTIMGHLAGIAMYDRLPGGADLRQAILAGEISRSAEADVCRDHFQELVNMSVARAKAVGILIKHVILTHPVYFCPEIDYLDKYKRCYQGLIVPILHAADLQVQISWVSEGQATALYTSEPFQDPVGAFDRAGLLRVFSDLYRESKTLHMVVVDCGSSTLTIQNQHISFDENGIVEKGTSEYGPDSKNGALGGSYVTNCWVKEYICEMASMLSTENQVALLNDFESQKYKINPQQEKRIVLKGEEPDAALYLDPAFIYNAFNTAFDAGIKVTKAEIDRVAKLGSDFAVVFCGGSYLNEGLYKSIQAYMKEVERAALERGVRVRHAFLADHDYTWSSAVSAGGAVSVLRVPPPVELLEGAALGIQIAWERPTEWDGESIARVLFVKGHRIGDESLVWDFNTNLLPGDIMFKLVCCPGYQKDVHWAAAKDYFRRPRHRNRRRQGTVRVGPRPKRYKTGHKMEVASVIAITLPGKTIYEMGFHLCVADLPPGCVRIWIEGNDADLLAGPPEDHVGLADKSSIFFTLRCCQVNTSTRQNQHHPLNKNWRLKLVTCPAAKLVIVGDEHPLPQLVWCSNCGDVIRSAGRECTVCRYLFRLCWDCYNVAGVAHEHALEPLDINPV